MLTTKAIFMAIHRMEGAKVMQYIMPGVRTIREIPGSFHFLALCVWLCTFFPVCYITYRTLDRVTNKDLNLEH